MKKLLVLLALLLALCPLCALAADSSASLVDGGDGNAVLFTDDAGNTYLLLITAEGVEVVPISEAEADDGYDADYNYGYDYNYNNNYNDNYGYNSDYAYNYDMGEWVLRDEICWRCGELRAAGDHSAGTCGFKYHSACMDAYFTQPSDHELCPICESCMCSSGSSHGIGYGMCGAELMEQACINCGQPLSLHKVHGDSDAPDTGCRWHCWLENPHAPCALCGKPLCNGQKHAKGECNKGVNRLK